MKADFRANSVSTIRYDRGNRLGAERWNRSGGFERLVREGAWSDSVVNGNVVCDGLEQRVWSDSIVNGNVCMQTGWSSGFGAIAS
jgi:hypothetical protein